MKNSAFVFLKPHAVTDKTKEWVKKRFEEKGMTVYKEGSLTAEEIDKDKLIDSHYYAIASKATLQKPSQLNVPKDKFKEFFDENWSDVVKTKVFNAIDACEKLGLDADELDKEWAKAKANKKLVKFGGGFYCGLVEVKDKDPIYVMNGFFMSMRSKFVAPGTSIYYYIVEWDQNQVSWADFRGKVLGPTDPKDAPADSLRGEIYRDWKKLGLEYQPNIGDNAVHASASPFEALAERMNWLKHRPQRDPFGKQLLKVADKKQIDQWCKDPQVKYGPIEITKSLYDSLEDTDTDTCLALCQMIALGVPPSEKEQKKINALRAENENIKQHLGRLQELSQAINKMIGFDFQGYRALVPKGSGKGWGSSQGRGHESPGKAGSSKARSGGGKGGGGKGGGKGNKNQSQGRDQQGSQGRKRNRKGRGGGNWEALEGNRG